MDLLAKGGGAEAVTFPPLLIGGMFPESNTIPICCLKWGHYVKSGKFRESFCSRDDSVERPHHPPTGEHRRFLPSAILGTSFEVSRVLRLLPKEVDVSISHIGDCFGGCLQFPLSTIE
jgi:hypothetical protein